MQGLIRYVFYSTQSLTPKSRNFWLDGEKEKLIKAVSQIKDQKRGRWSRISDLVGTKSYIQCYHKWNRLVNPEVRKGRFTKDEDALLEAGVLTYGYGNWKKISEFVGFRTPQQVRMRAILLAERRTYNRGRWTEDEDERLLKGVGRFPNVSSIHFMLDPWVEVSKVVRTRGAIHCFMRYQKLAYRPRPWTNEEILKLLSAEACHGTRWTRIRDLYFKNRSVVQISSYYHYLLKKAGGKKQLDHLVGRLLANREKSTHREAKADEKQMVKSGK